MNMEIAFNELKYDLTGFQDAYVHP